MSKENDIPELKAREVKNLIGCGFSFGVLFCIFMIFVLHYLNN